MTPSSVRLVIVADVLPSYGLSAAVMLPVRALAVISPVVTGWKDTR